MTKSSEAEVVQRILKLLEQGPKNFYAILQSLADVEYRTILIAWGSVREKNLLRRDDHGNYLLAAQESKGR
ncbi:MAG: hypothetical protein HY661_06610 [Betaproteobacteria bacterium]|nr:hypothetical protein [Betaproteobacteria bacterium]